MTVTSHHTVAPAADELAVPALVARIQTRALLIGVGGAALAIVGAIVQPQQFFRSYLVGFMLCLGLTLGSLALLMLQYLTKGNWGFVIRRQLEAGSRTLPLMAVLFIPLVIAVATNSMYPWAGHLSAEEKLMAKFQHYMTPTGFYGRAVIYFLIWFVLQFLLNRWGKCQDQRDEPDVLRSRRFQRLAGPGIILYALSITLASVDWVMSLDPHWYSTIYGMIFMVGQGLIAMTFCIMLTYALSKYKPVSDIMQSQYWHDLGNLTLAMVMLFAYLSFSQFLIIWSGNLPEEIEWYLNRLRGGWEWWMLAIVLFHFAVPFFFLLLKETKRNPRNLIKIAAMLFIARYLDMVWYIMPNFPQVGDLPNMRGHFYFSWLYLVTPVALIALWIAAFCRQLKSRPLYPVHDLLWPEITVQHHGH